jgi:hypothetical protein
MYLHCNMKWLQTALNLRIDDLAKQEWFEDLSENSLCTNYRIIKTELCMSKYLVNLTTPDRKVLCRFRCGNHRLPITTGRYNNIDRINRTCTLCNSPEIADEFHYIFACQYFKNERNKLLPSHLRNQPNTIKMHALFNTNKRKLQCDLIKFIKIITSHF